MRPVRFLFLAAGLLAAVFCSDSSSPTQPMMPTATPAGGATATPIPAMTPTPSPSAHEVSIGAGGSNSFRDSRSGGGTTTIRAGETVTWTWMSGLHSTTSGACCSGDGVWDSGTRSSGTFSHTFPSAGTFAYFCTVHGTMMTGTVVVNP